MPCSDPSGAPPGDGARARAGSEPAGADGRHDETVARILGFFFLALALPVVAGIWFASLPIDRLLNVAAAVALSGAGAVFLAWSRRLRRGSGAGGARL